MLERTQLERDLIARAKLRLDRLALYPEPVRTGRVRILHVPWLFRLPWFRRFHGYDVGPLILLAIPLDEVSEDLVTHELCHAWQAQHRIVRMWLSYLWQGYDRNTHEIEARRAVADTRPAAAGPITRERPTG
jgi:hypothetical protein